MENLPVPNKTVTVLLGNAGGVDYVAGDRSVMFLLNKPGDSRVTAPQSNATLADAETKKPVSTVFALYPAGTTATDKVLEDDAYLNTMPLAANMPMAHVSHFRRTR